MIRSAMPMSSDFIAEVIDQSSAGLAQHAATLQLERSPNLRDRFGPRSAETLAADTRVRVAFLADAVALEEPVLFLAQVAWTRAALDARRVPIDHLRQNLRIVSELIAERLPAEVAGPATSIMNTALASLDAPTHIAPSAIEGDGRFQRIARAYLLAMLEADRAAACDLLLAAVHAGTSVVDIYERIIQPAHFEVGRMWHLGEITVAEEHYITAAAEWVLPQLARIAPRAERNGRTIVSTAADGDYHSFGLRIVTDCFELGGWRTYFLGASTPVPDVVQAMYDQKADLLGVSASLGCHIRSVRGLITHIRAEPEVRSTPILVGGEPFNLVPDLWRKVGADGSAKNATDAVALGNTLVANRHQS